MGNRDQKCKSMQISWRSKSIEKKLTMEFKEQKGIIEQKLILRHLLHLVYNGSLNSRVANA